MNTWHEKDDDDDRENHVQMIKVDHVHAKSIEMEWSDIRSRGTTPTGKNNPKKNKND